MDAKELLNEIDWALDSILPIEERVVEGQRTMMIMQAISQLRGHLLRVRDDIVVEDKIKGRRELYHPLEALTKKVLKSYYPDMPDNLAERHFDESSYRKISKANRSII